MANHNHTASETLNQKPTAANDGEKVLDQMYEYYARRVRPAPVVSDLDSRPAA